ncbi:hypothetical protein GETHLI_29290 [Geothrix limicola]|uniref:ABC-2 type transport system permease protein n=1 Tax=Geothrix limicola TaxID=2927978 RepID=A0ABQ5QIA7_9BACT|nr:hypothetical protein [Geothrix limicola]GLH74427.1 hypothetical protein GETHLI_29290 [Geothrix limicola]
MALGSRLVVFRALLAAHAQTSWNRSAREMGRQGVVLMITLTCLVGLLGVGPLFLGLGALGWMLGGTLQKPLAVGFLGLVLALIGLGGGLFGGVLGGARQLNWEAYRGFPLKLRTLYFAELVAGLGDPLPLLLGAGLAAFVTGLAIGSPALLPLLPLILVETLFTLLALQLLVGGLAAALVKRLRLALTLLIMLAWVGSTLATSQLPHRAKAHETTPVAAPQRAERNARIEAMTRRGLAILSALPSHAAAESLARVREGRWASAFALHAYPLAVLALLMLLGARVVARESRDERTVEAPRGPDRLWTFQGPAEGIGRLHFRTLMASQLGRFAFLMPVMTLVLLKGPFAQMRGQSLWAVPAAFAYLSLVGNNVMLNQFGLDRHGVKALLLLPVTAEDLLKGKLLGMAAHQGLQALLLALLLAVFERATLAPLLAGVLMLGCVFLAQGCVGQWTSLWAPRPMAMNSLKNSNMPFAVGMLSLATSGLWTGLFGGAFALCAWLAPAWLVPLMALLFGLTLLAHLALLPTAAAYLDRRREILVERLG